MPDYADGQDVLLRRPEPGRPPRPTPNSVENKNKEVKIDINAIAEAVVKAMGTRFNSAQPIATSGQRIENAIDDFDSSASMEKLANVMSIQSDGNESNLDGLGMIRETKKDKEDTKKTIDILSNLKD